MSLKTNAMRQLDAAKIPYVLHDFLPLKEGEELTYDDIASRTGRARDEIFKTILAKGQTGNHYVLVLRGTDSVDLKKAARVCGEKAMELLDVRDLEKVTGYVRGGCSPVGMKKRFPTVFDEQALEYETILVSAGKRGYQVLVAPQALIDLLDARVADLRADQTAIF